MRLTLIALATASAAALVGCGSSSSTSASSLEEAPAADTVDQTKTTPAPKPKKPRAHGAAVQVASTAYGRALLDGRGFALYVFSADARARSNCSGACAKAWPPLITKGDPVARHGAKQRLLGTTRRRDGKLQVTYKGRPLYYYVGDRKPHQILCQNAPEFGGLWTVVSPAGAPIR